MTLDLWAPPGAPGNPVTVFVHGGGSLAASPPRAALYDDGATFSRDGVVLVTVNDRLGAAGSLDVYVLATQIRSGAATLVAQYRARHPRASPGERGPSPLGAPGRGTVRRRQPARLAKAHPAQHTAPTHTYAFACRSPALDGRLGATHPLRERGGERSGR
ncbi:hypothetical protein [Streptomyces noursei]|uniref:hypothetical protein n=1 Tax=Streptomyces noursei TaxID=1971 RepID=UPI003558DDDF